MIRKPYFMLVIAIFIFTLSSCSEDESSLGGASDNNNVVLQVPLIPQQTEVWCWAAVVEMVSAYRGRRASQCETLDFTFGVQGCCFNPLLCAVPGNLPQIQQALFALNIGSSLVNRALTWDELTFEIDNGRPIVIAYTGSFVGHVVVGYGYNRNRGTVYINDPFFGGFEVPYSVTFNYQNSLSWAQTIVGIL